ncbi:Crp/Fnr family transcriptional regulator [Formosa sediminum]|uniref:Crp/Fnr family transcriptional regulator n=1 Tax=Formosa sediminum TaxID=2594004 RepID=A0A516GS73_9FLAO|nr:Crp/Fnr family transcriptional regulator [Formosa sediminum]QDO94362.1 Crp/Fnr family transcriptional regulator [Formosa sediminum]
MRDCEQCMVRKLSALKLLKGEEIKAISGCKITKSIKKGEVVFKEGDMLNGVYCISKGICKLTKLTEKGKDQVVKLVIKGELLGQRSVIINQTANLTATALNDMEVCFIPKQEIIQDLLKNNDFSFGVLKQMASDLKEAEISIVNMAQKSVRKRLADIILYLNNNFGVDESNYLKVTLSRDDFASIVGTATESVIRTLSQFKKEGLIKTSGKKIQIINYDELELME